MRGYFLCVIFLFSSALRMRCLPSTDWLLPPLSSLRLRHSSGAGDWPLADFVTHNSLKSAVYMVMEEEGVRIRCILLYCKHFIPKSSGFCLVSSTRTVNILQDLSFLSSYSILCNFQHSNWTNLNMIHSNVMAKPLSNFTHVA